MPRFVDPIEDFDRLFEMFGSRGVGGAVMPMDAYEKDGLYTLRFDLAGADRDAVDVTVEGGTLTVSAERPLEDTEGVNWLVRERPTGTHSRQVKLANSLDVDAVEAEYDRGVLTVRIPTRPNARPQRISVTGGGAQAAIDS